MTTRCTVTAPATTLAALAAGGLLLTSAGTAFAQNGTAPVPGMVRMHQQLNGSGLGMTRMHELHAEQNRAWPACTS